MREMSKSAVSIARGALAVGEASLPRYASKFSRRDGYTLPQLFAVLAVRKFLGQDYRGMQTLLNEWSDLRDAVGLTKSPDYSTLCLAEAKLAREGGLSTASYMPASSVPAGSACSTIRPKRPSTPPGSRRGTRRPTSAAASAAPSARTRPGPSSRQRSTASRT